jgi:hypothetical protein
MNFLSYYIKDMHINMSAFYVVDAVTFISIHVRNFIKMYERVAFMTFLTWNF